MTTVSKERILPNNRKFLLVFLATFSVCGCALGVAAAKNTDPNIFSMMRQAAWFQVSIVDLLFAILFPFVITAVISYISKPILLLPLCFAKSIGYSFLLCSVSMEFADAGWLVGSLLLFSDTACILLMYFYCLRYLNGFQKRCGRDIIVSVVAVSAVAVIDVWLVSPYLSVLIKS